jgi:nucleoside-diphosphate-sugar epimerase
LIELIASASEKNKFVDKNVKVNYGEKRPGEIVNSYASIEKAKELLGYSPEVFLREGLERYLYALKIEDPKLKSAQ